MTLRVGINGFGRIGRLTLRAWYLQHRGDFEVVAHKPTQPQWDKFTRTLLEHGKARVRLPRVA